MDGRIGWIGNWPVYLNTNIFLAVSKCPAAGQGLEWTKCPAVRNFHRVSTERLFQIS